MVIQNSFVHGGRGVPLLRSKTPVEEWYGKLDAPKEYLHEEITRVLGRPKDNNNQVLSQTAKFKNFGALELL